MSALRAIAASAAVLALAAACGNDKLRRAAEGVEVVSGTPTVGTGLPGVDRADAGTSPIYGPAAPFQVDSFQQQQVSKVDILWIIDDSPSMAPKQNRLKDNVKSFIQFLSSQQIDYHLGVTTTDTFNPLESGRLVNKAGLARPWVSSADGTNAQAYFVANAGVGEGGSGDEKALLGGMFALTAPLSPLSPPSASAFSTSGAGNCALVNGQVECFLRPDAALYTILISDEEDSSCSPILPSTEGCTEADIRASPTGFGSIDYWSRFYAGIKGTGGISRLAAITGTDSTMHDCATEFAGYCDSSVLSACAGNTADCSMGAGGACCSAIYGCYRSLFSIAQWCTASPYPSSGQTTGYQITGSWPGCKATHVDTTTNKTVIDFTAYYAPRYSTVAVNTGGLATSICDADYTPALKNLGLQASGLRSDFPLSRAPISTSITLLVTPPGGSPAPVPQGSGTWQYVGCEGHTAVNVIRFSDAARPVAGSKIAASYDVSVRGLTCP